MVPLQSKGEGMSGAVLAQVSRFPIYLTGILTVFLTNGALASQQRSDYFCPNAEPAELVLIEKGVDVYGRKLCHFKVTFGDHEPSVPFPLQYILMDCSRNWASMFKDRLYTGTLFFRHLGNDENGSPLCHPRFAVDE